MQSKSKNENQIEANPYNISPSTVCGEPWWRSAGYSTISPAVMQANASNSSSLEQSIDSQSQSEGGFNEEDDDATKESENTAPCSEGNYGQGQRDPQHGASNIAPRSDESITQPPQLELVGHSIACASNPYCDPYYGGMMAAYGQPLVYPHLLNMHQPRLPLPLEMAPEPVYVNAKQYNGILRRRQSRAKAELEKKLIKDRKPYLHESRHQHAMRRARASGGRFAKKSNVNDSKNAGEEKGTGCSSASSSGPEPSQPTYVNNSGRCENRDSFEASKYGAERGDGGSAGKQQWGSLRSNQASQRAVAMQ